MKKTVLPTVVVAVLYLALVVFVINHSLVETTIIGDYPLFYKVSLLVSLLGGLGATMSELGILTVLLIAILTGLNLTLSVQRIKRTRKNRSQMPVFGGAFLGIAGAGCGACGLPAASFLGLGGSLTFLPLRGQELSLIAVVLLMVSLFFLIKSSKVKSCKLPT